MSRVDDEAVGAALEASTAPLDADFAKRVHAIARAELATASSGFDALGQVRLALSGALVPALLVSAAGIRVAQTVETAQKVFVSEDPGAKG